MIQLNYILLTLVTVFEEVVETQMVKRFYMANLKHKYQIVAIHFLLSHPLVLISICIELG
jgi:hypothetical protein